jgi:predicted acetyltransferase
VTGDEMLAARYALGTYAFRASPPLPDKDEWMDSFRGRPQAPYVAAYEDGLPVAAVGSVMLTQNVRGALFGAGGICGVASDPAARRKGYARRLLGQMLAHFQANRRPFSCLYPFRESFYERLGYVTFPLVRIARFNSAALGALVARDLGGHVERRQWSDDFQLYSAYLAELRPGIHGFGIFEQADHAAAERNPRWLAQAFVDGELVGTMLYKLTGDDLTHFTLHAGNFYYSTSQGRYLLLQWIAHHVDHAENVELVLPPWEQPETWLADLRVRIDSAERAPMGRVVDVAAIGGLHVGLGTFAARIVDPLCSWNEGSWRFTSRDGILAVERTGTGDCELTIQGLSGLVYGTHDPADFAIRGWGNPPPALQVTLRAMFPPLQPYLHETF